MTDINWLIASIKRRSAHAKDFGDDVTFVKLEDLDALEKAQTINAAAEKLVRCKGRYHSEQNYRALAALFGVKTPDLPPLDSESRTVTVKLPDDEDGQAYGFGKWSNGKLPATAGTMTIAYCEDAWRAAFEVFASAVGIKVEAE
ncbi:Ead domain protein [Klebsiella pneumoniae]|uniref:Ead domain protein n=1 Tax=Klebsiella pneumoniae TaxID=573 RepID=A0A378ACE9_KLEPN|nr:Ead domain protein [Klebsiella pneumoniae]STV05698.1 Ead domain protein [Klebsiella pneumoniae]